MAGVSPERLRAIALACLVEPGTPGIAELVAEHGAEAVLARARHDNGGPPAWSDVSTRSRCPTCWRRCPGAASGSCSRASRSSPASCSTSPSPRWPCGSGGRWTCGRPHCARSRSSGPGPARPTASAPRPPWPEGWPRTGGRWSRAGRSGSTRPRIGRPWLSAARRSPCSPAGSTSPTPGPTTPCSRRIADSGLVVSELPPGSQPLKHRFLARNRVIAALSRGRSSWRPPGAVVRCPPPRGRWSSAGWSWPCPARSPRWPAPGPTACCMSRWHGPSATASRSRRCSPECGGHRRGDRTRGPADAAERPSAGRVSRGLPDEARAVLEALPGRGTRSVEVGSRSARASAPRPAWRTWGCSRSWDSPDARGRDGADVRDTWGSMGT